MLNGDDKRTLYPPIEPSQSGYLSVDGGHQIYWEESGNPNGKPVLFLHGGPGIGTMPYHRSFFNPDLFRIILFDQRGCGKSLPFSKLEQNTSRAYFKKNTEKLTEKYDGFFNRFSYGRQP
jgi:proline iminopeptidase